MQKNISLGVVCYPLRDNYDYLGNALFEIKRKKLDNCTFLFFPIYF